MAKRKRESAASITRRFLRSASRNGGGLDCIQVLRLNPKWVAKLYGGPSRFSCEFGEGSTAVAAMRAALAKVERED